MCKYNYIYHSACQHGELTRLTSCPDATAPGLPKFDNLSPDSAGAGHPPGDPSRPSPPHPPATSAKYSRSSSHNQPHHHHNMSTLNPSEAGQPYARKFTAFECEQHQTSDMTFTPRSALNDGMHGSDTRTPPTASSSGNLDIDFSLYSRATLSLEVVCDANRIPSSLTSPISGSDAGTARGPLEDSRPTQADSHTARHLGQAAHSPRKSLPSHWLPKGSGPNLATAQRAKERSYKKDSQSGSPIEVKTIRGARSSIDISKSYGLDSPTYLTKEALAAVENDVASPTTTHGPNKLHRSPSKPSWRSPTTSPLRSSPSQHTTINTKMSPTRSALLNFGTASGGHSRAPSSVAASCGSFHTANESPVRSPSDTELSFQSALEHLDDLELPHLKLDTDSEVLQPRRHHNNASTVKQKAATVGKTSPIRPRLALQIPNTGSAANTDSDATLVATSGSSTTNLSSSSSEPPQLASRIPRVTGSVKSGSAYSATRSSTLKRAQSIRTLAAKSNIQQDQNDEPHQIPLPETPAAASSRHVRTLNSLGTTPILSRHSAQETGRPSYSLAELQRACSTLGLATHEQLDQLAPSTTRTDSASQQESIDLAKYSGTEQVSRATSAATVKASPLLRDPVPTDSAIIYSRKKGKDLSIILGTASCPSILKPLTMIVMMAQIPDLTVGVGNLNMRDTIETFEVATPTVESSTASSVRSRSDQYVPMVHQQTGSQHSLHSSSGSELRATAPNFVPQPTPGGPPQFTFDKPAESVPIDTPAPPQFEQAPWFPLDMSGLDKYGIPWFYYMYPVQFAYDQGFRNGRTKSPRKFKPKKQRQSMSSPFDAQQPSLGPKSFASVAAPAVPPPANMSRRLASGELMPPPPIPAHRRQQGSKENSLRGGSEFRAHDSDMSRNVHDPDVPFARQLDVIAQRDVLCNNTNVNRHRGPNVDLTTFHNVGSYQETHNRPYTNYHTVSMRHGRYHHRHAGNGLYNGRGSGGVPMYATTPFPDPSPPQGRPPMGAGGRPATMGTEACGLVDVVLAAELGGGMPCNTCAPDH